MEDGSVESSLQTYKTQLQQVNAALLAHGSGPEVEELVQLRDDLTQLIELTEESLHTDTETCDDESPVAARDASTSSPISSRTNEVAVCSNPPAGDKNDDTPIDDEMARFYAEMGHSVLNHDEEKNSEEMPNQNSSKSSNSPEILTQSKLTDTHRSEKNQSRDVSPIATDSLNDEFLDSIQELNDVSGVKCQAPFVTEWSGTQYHNAMIEGSAMKDEAISGEDEEDVNDIKVKVLFLNPVLQTMRPCPYYLEGNCKFEEDGCRFSHGLTVSLYELRPFVPPDYSLLCEDATCLAKFKDGIWKPGIVGKIEDETCNIRFLHSNVTLPLQIEDIIPQISHSDDEDLQLSDLDDDIITEIVPHSVYAPTDASSDSPPALGLWEKHTHGLGSKLMQKMGYKPGEGLGKKSQGRVEPVPIVLLPRGKSLDHCMNLKLRKGIKCVDDVTNKSAKVQEGGVQQSRRRKKRTCVFSFLNKTLGGDRRQGKYDAKKVAEAPKDLFGRKEGKEKKNSKMFNKEMFKNEEEMKKLQEKINKIKKSLRRNEGNPSVLKSMNAKLKELETAMKRMKEYETNLKKHKTRVETHRKMTAF